MFYYIFMSSQTGYRNIYIFYGNKDMLYKFLHSKSEF